MGKKRPSERGDKQAEAVVGPKRPRAGSLGPADSAFEPTVQGRAHGSSTTPLKAILEDYAEQQRQAKDANGGDDGMVGLHIGFDIPDAVPAGATAAAGD